MASSSSKKNSTMAAPDLAITSIGDVCKNCKGNMIGTKDVAEVADWCLHCLNLVADPGRHDHICTFDFQGRATRCNYCQMQNKNSKECIGVCPDTPERFTANTLVDAAASLTEVELKLAVLKDKHTLATDQKKEQDVVEIHQLRDRDLPAAQAKYNEAVMAWKAVFKEKKTVLEMAAAQVEKWQRYPPTSGMDKGKLLARKKPKPSDPAADPVEASREIQILDNLVISMDQGVQALHKIFDDSHNAALHERASKLLMSIMNGSSHLFMTAEAAQTRLSAAYQTCGDHMVLDAQATNLAHGEQHTTGNTQNNPFQSLQGYNDNNPVVNSFSVAGHPAAGNYSNNFFQPAMPQFQQGDALAMGNAACDNSWQQGHGGYNEAYSGRYHQAQNGMPESSQLAAARAQVPQIGQLSDAPVHFDQGAYQEYDDSMQVFDAREAQPFNEYI